MNRERCAATGAPWHMWGRAKETHNSCDSHHSHSCDSTKPPYGKGMKILQEGVGKYSHSSNSAGPLQQLKMLEKYLSIGSRLVPNPLSLKTYKRTWPHWTVMKLAGFHWTMAKGVLFTNYFSCTVEFVAHWACATMKWWPAAFSQYSCSSLA